ncbi:hypothetical protein [Rhizobium mesoamericanum]|nr:hypothetical protein [Rhizobium mesoamericanum]
MRERHATPGYWLSANFASAAVTLDHLTGGPVRVNTVFGLKP